MRSTFSKIASSTVFAGSLVLTAIGGAGCDRSATADEQVVDKMTEGRVALAAGSEQGLRQAIEAFEAASNVGGASESSVAQAKSALGAAHMSAARVSIDQSARHEAAAAQIMLDIAGLARQVAAGNALVSGYQQLDPKAAQADVAAKIAEARGGPDKAAWIAGDKGSIPTLSAVAQEISRIESEIAAKQNESRDLDAQRIAALEAVERESRASDSLKGQESVDAFVRAADARRKASDLATRIEVINAQLAPLRAELSIAQGQQQVVNAAIADLEAQSKAMEAGWSEVQKQTSVQKALSQQFVQGGGSTGTPPGEAAGKSMSEKAKALIDESKKADEAREAALVHLRDSAKLFEDAATSAETAWSKWQSAMGDEAKKASRVAFQTASDVNSTSQYRMQLASANSTMANLYVARGAELMARKQVADLVTPILSAGGLSLPEAISTGDADAKIKESFELADKFFDSASSMLENVATGRAQSEIDKTAVNAAKVDRIVILYARSQACTLAGNDAKAKEYDAMARQAVKAAHGDGVRLPSLPGDLSSAIPVPAPVTPPSTQPAGTPGA